jgi:hypothetical protein
MNRLTIAKLAFALSGIALFAYGARVEDGTIWWLPFCSGSRGGPTATRPSEATSKPPQR